MLPNFLFLGPDKAGSSWLFRLLREHPQCFVPECKDIYFFDRYFDRGIDWYESFFDPAPPGAIAVGELSHDYLFSDAAAERIGRVVPDAKLFIVLRNPAERTWSQYLYMLRNGYPAADFDDALRKYPFLVTNSRYAEHLERYADAFESGKLRIFWFDDLKRSPGAFAGQIAGFLGVSENGIKVPGPERSAAQARNPRLSAIAKRAAIMLRDRGATRLVGRLKHSRLSRILSRP